MDGVEGRYWNANGMANLTAIQTTLIADKSTSYFTFIPLTITEYRHGFRTHMHYILQNWRHSQFGQTFHNGISEFVLCRQLLFCLPMNSIWPLPIAHCPLSILWISDYCLLLKIPQWIEWRWWKLCKTQTYNRALHTCRDWLVVARPRIGIKMVSINLNFPYCMVNFVNIYSFPIVIRFDSFHSGYLVNRTGLAVRSVGRLICSVSE